LVGGGTVADVIVGVLLLLALIVLAGLAAVLMTRWTLHK
jgi:hypothetical protein